MAFSIHCTTRENVEFLVMENETTKEYVEIIPDLGGTVHKICILVDGEIKNILLSDEDADIVEHNLYKARILFPFNDRIPDGKYSFDGMNYQLDINSPEDNSAIHGFLYNEQMDFIDKELEDDYCTATLKTRIKAGEFNGYPFDLSLIVKYIFTKDSLRLEFEMENYGDKACPAALGWHPYFTFNNSLTDTSLTCNAKKYCEFDESFLPTGKILDCENTDYDFNAGKEIADMQIDNAFLTPEDGMVLLQKGNTTIEYKQDTNVFKYIQFFIPPQQNAIAIEPITSCANSFNMPELGLLVMNPGDIVKTWITLTIK